MRERAIRESDIRHVLNNGEAFGAAEPSTQAGLFKYKIQSETPNTDGAIIRIVVIPCLETLSINILTVMWAGNGLKQIREMTEGARGK